MTDEQKQVLKTLYGHEFGRIVRKLGQGGLGAAYLADLTNPLHVLASRITHGEENPRLFGLEDIPFDEANPAQIRNPEYRKRIHDAAQSYFIQIGPPHDKKPQAALEQYTVLLEHIDPVLVKQQRDGQIPVVVKVLKQRSESDKDLEKMLNEDARNRFLQEARILKKLNHKNIVRTFGIVDACDVGTCLLLEHINGVALDAYLNSQPDRRIAPQKASEIMASLLETVDYMHGQGVIHRDIKPSNIILRPDLSPVIIDFGICKDIDTSMTMAGARMGTPGYMAPEVAREGITEKTATPLIDVYALGTIFFEMLAGRRAYEGNIDEILQKVAGKRHPTRLTEFAGSISDELVYLVEAARAKDPDKRLTMEQFRHGLDEIREKKQYNRPAPRDSTTIVLLKERARAGARRKTSAMQEEELSEELKSRILDDRLKDVQSKIEVGLYEPAKKELEDLLNCADNDTRQKLEGMMATVTKELARQSAIRHIEETKRRLKDKDVLGAEGMLDEAKKHMQQLPEKEFETLHAEYRKISDDYDTRFRMGATAIKSLRGAIEKVKQQVS
ncbi:MAG: protein kinase, partial [Candidatus Woesearchaeota archaeon]